MECCCNEQPVKTPPVRRVFGLAKWAAPIVGLAIVPKCPACLAGYVLLATGVGMSFSTASMLRWGMIGVCGVGLAVLLGRVGLRWWKTVRS